MRDHVIEIENIDKETGLKYYVVFNSMGNRCGYVEIPYYVYANISAKHNMNMHKLFANVTTDNVSNTASIISLSRRMKENKTNRHLKVKYNAVSDIDKLSVHGGVTFSDKLNIIGRDTYAIGFDCGHYCDKRDVEAFKKYFKEVCSTSIYKIIVNTNTHGEVRTQEYVEEQCKLLAKQLKATEHYLITKERERIRKNWAKKA